jgi:hypothetical protein
MMTGLRATSVVVAQTLKKIHYFPVIVLLFWQGILAEGEESVWLTS